MGLFDFLKKKKTEITVTMKGYENGVEVPLKDEPNDPNDRIMPISYYRTLEKEIKPLENVMVGFAVASREQKDVDNKIKVLEAFVESYEALKEKCNSLGPDYQEYFWQAYEKPREKRGKPWKYAKQFIDELNDLKIRRDSIYSEQQRRSASLANLDARLLSFLKDNPGIIQSNVYKHFDSTIKGDISEKLYFWEKDGLIERTKSGRSYSIRVRG